MEREERAALNARIEANHQLAKHRNKSEAEGFVNTSKGRRFHKNGMGQPRGGRNGRRG